MYLFFSYKKALRKANDSIKQLQALELAETKPNEAKWSKTLMH